MSWTAMEIFLWSLVAVLCAGAIGHAAPSASSASARRACSGLSNLMQCMLGPTSSYAAWVLLG